MGHLKPETLFSDRYLLKQQLGVGGFSEVWLALDIKTGKLEVALKIFAPEKGLDVKGIEVFSREYSLVFNLNHPHLLVPKHFDVYEGSPYLVMPYCKKGSMNEKIGEMTESELAKFIQQSSSALLYLHNQEPPIIHQDIKPDNFLIDNNENYLIADFGISSKIRSTLTKSIGNKGSSGTMAYMPPEKWTRERQIIKAGDVFSLGVTLYEIASGELPFGEQGGLVLNTGAEIPDLPKSFSPELNNIVRSCMAKEPWERPTAEKLEKVAIEYQKNGRWQSDEKKVPEEKIQIDIEDKEHQPENKVPDENVKNDIAIEKPLSRSPGKAHWIIPTIIGTIICALILAAFFSYYSGPSVKELEEKRIADSILVADSLAMVQAEQQRIADSIAKVQEEKIIADSIAYSESMKLGLIKNAPWYNDYDDYGSFADDRAYVKKSGYYGYVDLSKQIVIQLQFDDAWSFSNERAKVKKNGKYGIIDIYGNVKIPIVYDDIVVFNSKNEVNIYKVKLKNQYGLFNRDGIKVLAVDYEGIGPLQESMSKIKKGINFGFINNEGKIAVDLKYTDAGNFKCGLAYVFDPNLGNFFINKNGEAVFTLSGLNIECYYGGGFVNDMLLVRTNCEKGLYGFVDKTGKLAIPCQYEDANSFSFNDNAYVKKNGKWFYIDKYGNCVKDCP